MTRGAVSEDMLRVSDYTTTVCLNTATVMALYSLIIY